MQVADIHAHVFPDKIAEKASASIGDFYTQPMCHTASLTVLKEEEAKAGVCSFVISSSATDAEQAARINIFISSCAANDPQIIGFGSLFPGMACWEAELEHMQALGLRGIKIHSDFQHMDIDDPSSIAMYRGIAKAGLPVLFHMGDARYDHSSPQRLTNLIRQVPDLIAIAAHFGGWRSWERAYDHVLPENVFYDTSSSLMYLGKERGLDFLDKLGAHRFLFGSDFPMWTPEIELQRFLDLGLDPAARDRILFGNYSRLFL